MVAVALFVVVNVALVVVAGVVVVVFLKYLRVLPFMLLFPLQVFDILV